MPREPATPLPCAAATPLHWAPVTPSLQHACRPGALSLSQCCFLEASVKEIEDFSRVYMER